jgi:transposase
MGLVGVEQCVDLGREHVVRGVSIKQLASRPGLSRNTGARRCVRRRRRSTDVSRPGRSSIRSRT